MTVLHRVHDHPHLAKDPSSKAVLNIDPGAIARHEQRLARVHKEQAREEEINNLKDQLNRLQTMVEKLIRANTPNG